MVVQEGPLLPLDCSPRNLFCLGEGLGEVLAELAVVLTGEGEAGEGDPSLLETQFHVMTREHRYGFFGPCNSNIWDSPESLAAN